MRFHRAFRFPSSAVRRILRATAVGLTGVIAGCPVPLGFRFLARRRYVVATDRSH
jgi:hypothetical protein